MRHRISSDPDLVNQALRLNARVRELREQRGWSQQELATAAGMSISGVYLIERGRIPTIPAVLALARGLGIAPRHLFGALE
jgi:transcriptional regulator with XRE-family HTH domain